LAEANVGLSVSHLWSLSRRRFNFGERTAEVAAKALYRQRRLQ